MLSAVKKRFINLDNKVYGATAAMGCILGGVKDEALAGYQEVRENKKESKGSVTSEPVVSGNGSFDGNVSEVDSWTQAEKDAFVARMKEKYKVEEPVEEEPVVTEEPVEEPVVEVEVEEEPVVTEAPVSTEPVILKESGRVVENEEEEVVDKEAEARKHKIDTDMVMHVASEMITIIKEGVLTKYGEADRLDDLFDILIDYKYDSPEAFNEVFQEESYRQLVTLASEYLETSKFYDVEKTIYIKNNIDKVTGEYPVTKGNAFYCPMADKFPVIKEYFRGSRYSYNRVSAAVINVPGEGFILEYGINFCKYPEDIQEFIVYHEIGHIVNGDFINHTGERSLRRELAADAYAAKMTSPEVGLKVMNYYMEHFPWTRDEVSIRLKQTQEMALEFSPKGVFEAASRIVNAPATPTETSINNKVFLNKLTNKKAVKELVIALINVGLTEEEAEVKAEEILRGVAVKELKQKGPGFARKVGRLAGFVFNAFESFLARFKRVSVA